MSGSLQKVAAGGLGLCFLDVVLTSPWAPTRLQTGGANAKAVLARILDPSLPLIGAKAATGTAAAAYAAIPASTTPAGDAGTGDIPVNPVASGSVSGGVA